MKHARKDYNRIQDPSGKIPIDEPVFLLRGQDLTAPNTVRFWANAQKQNPQAEPKIILLAEQWANKMEEWQHKHGCKYADLPKPIEPQSSDDRPSNNSKRSDLWEQIYSIVSKLKLDKPKGDAYDFPTITTELERLILSQSPDADKHHDDH